MSMLEAIGFGELIAASPEEYFSKSVELACDDARREKLHLTLRDQMVRSPLMNGREMAAALEDAYRDMWKMWCEKGKQHYK